MTRLSANGEAALEYARRGWYVFQTRWITKDGSCSCGRECSSPGKHPVQKRGVLDATRDVQRIRAWWQTLPMANVAIATGWESKLYVVDLDGDEGRETWAAIDDLIPTETLSAETGSGGTHLYFRLPFFGKGLRNTAKKLGPGIDTRGNGGYVLAPPSNHASGVDYAWLPGPAEPCELPAWLMQRLNRPERPAQPRPRVAAQRAQADDQVALRILDDEARLVARCQPGSRNHQLFKSAANVYELAYGGELSPDTVTAAMLEAAAACGLGVAETEATLKSAQQHGSSNPRIVRTRLLLEGARQ